MIDIEKTTLVKKTEIKDFFDFLFTTGTVDEKEKFTADGQLNMVQKKAVLSILITATRYNKNLKIQAKEGAFFHNIFAGQNDNILIPFKSTGGKYGLSVYLVFFAQRSGEDFSKGFKRVELHNYFTDGGSIKVKELFFEAMNMSDNQEDNSNDSSNEKAKKEDSDYLELKDFKYKVTKFDDGSFEVLNVSKNFSALNPHSPTALKIINLSKFKK